MCNVNSTSTSVESGGEIELNQTKIEPLPDGANVVNSVMVSNDAMYGYNTEIGNEFVPPDLMGFRVYDLNIEELWLGLYYVIPVNFEVVDYNFETQGTYRMNYTLDLDLLDIDFSGWVPLNVIDPTLPYLVTASWSALDEVRLGFAKFPNDADDIKLLYSVDHGESWKDASADFKVIMDSSDFRILGFDREQTYWVRIVVKGGAISGTSNILKV